MIYVLCEFLTDLLHRTKSINIFRPTAQSLNDFPKILKNKSLCSTKTTYAVGLML